MKFKISKWNNFMQYHYDAKVVEFASALDAWQHCRDLEKKEVGTIYHHEELRESK